MSGTIVRAALAQASTALAALLNDALALAAIEQAGELLAHSLQAGGRAFSCGNGGSLCDAMHFAE